VKSSQHMLRAMAGKLWFVHEQKMNEMLALVEMLSAAGPEALAAAHAEIELRAARPSTVSGSNNGMVSVIPVHGVISHRSSMFSYLFGGSSTGDLTQQLRQAVNDPNVRAIVMDIDSPGGDVDGVDELASEIYQAKKVKPITACVNCLCASAAYYLASQASEIVASPSSLTGSIGVYTIHEDYSEMLQNAGLKISVIKFGDNKAEGNPYEALSDPAREHLQEMVDTFGDAFEKAVARGRGVKQDEVHKKFGQGRVFDAKKAVKLGMVDRVGTLDDALAKHGAARPVGMRGSAERAFTAAEVCRIFSVPAAKVAEFLESEAAASHQNPEDAENVDDQEGSEDGSECACACSACKEGTCDACPCSACACDGCACDQTTSAHKKAAANRRRLQLAEL
jgi:signal peptide peptidase SppA